MSEDIANAIMLLLNAGADPQALKQATDPIENLTFIPVEDLPEQEVLQQPDASGEAGNLSLSDFAMTPEQNAKAVEKLAAHILAPNSLLEKCKH